MREQPIETSNGEAEITSSSEHNRISRGKNICSSVREQPIEPMLNLGVDELRKSLDFQQSLNQIEGLFYPDQDLLFSPYFIYFLLLFLHSVWPFLAAVSDSMESIEKDYVLVNAHCPSMETSSYHLETSLEGCSLRVSHALSIDQDMIAKTQKKELIATTRDVGESSRSRGQFSMPCAASMLKEVQGLSILHPSTRLQLFNQYVQVLSDLSKEKVSIKSWVYKHISNFLRINLEPDCCLCSVMQGCFWNHFRLD